MADGRPARPRTTRGESTQPAPMTRGITMPPTEPQRSPGAVAAAWLRGALLDNAPVKVVAMVLALTLFVLVHSDEKAVAGAKVRVNFGVPPSRVLVSDPIAEVSITVQGSRRTLKRFHESSLEPISIDLRDRPNGEVYFEPKMIKGLPEGVELVSITPASVKVALDERGVKELPILVITGGAPARGYKLEAAAASPPRVTVSGPASRLAGMESVHTAEVRLDGRSQPFSVLARLAPAPGLRVEGERPVQVQVRLAEEQGSREMELPVSIEPGHAVTPEQAARFSASPDRVHVVLRGSILSLDNVRTDQLFASVKVFPDDLKGSGDRTAEVHVSPPMTGIGYEVSPLEVTLKRRP